MSEPKTFETFFKDLTRFDSYDYQSRLAGGNAGDVCSSQLIDIPTGMGKTSAVIAAWLWNRVVLGREDWPLRLVYCLPMRTLVEQTRDNVMKWLDAASKSFPSDDIDWLKANSPIILMGGENSDSEQVEWDLHPERPAVLIGTQDMMLSRALNRGYGMSRYRWPMHFGLLNSDCLWVLDETQLMGVAIETSAQLEGLRLPGKLGSSAPSFTWWMSATLNETQLATVDHPILDNPLPICALSDTERKLESVRQRITAKKRLARHEAALENATAGDIKTYVASLTESILEHHEPGTLTLVVLNRVDRARDVYAAIQKSGSPDPIALIHSRFRPGDRSKHQATLMADGGRIVIATQAIEAGVDISARTMFTELAPWSSLIQRFGRCNRYGEFPDGADIFWIDLHSSDEKKMKSVAVPYEAEELLATRDVMLRLDSASSTTLAEHKIDPPMIVRPVIRRKDLLDLADTTPDLAGNDLDISRYVRDGDDRDVQLFWRAVEGELIEGDSQDAPTRKELCRVSIGEFIKFLPGPERPSAEDRKKRRIWRWNHLDKQWQREAIPRPGQTYLVDVEMGGYSDDLGWTGNKKDLPTLTETPDLESPEAYDGDRLSRLGILLSLEEHTQNVRREMSDITTAIGLGAETTDALDTAALWHDVGKAHPVFQDAILDEKASPDRLWAKGEKFDNYKRKHFRHELASALIWLQRGGADDETGTNLIAYLIAAHHGKVRFSIRALPGESEPESPNTLFARGIHDADLVPDESIAAITIDGLELPPTKLDLGLMRLGAGSWLERMISLLNAEQYGPFRLAYLETLLCAADRRASKKEVEHE